MRSHFEGAGISHVYQFFCLDCMENFHCIINTFSGKWIAISDRVWLATKQIICGCGQCASAFSGHNNGIGFITSQPNM